MISWQTAAHWPYVEAPFPFYLVFYDRAPHDVLVARSSVVVNMAYAIRRCRSKGSDPNSAKGQSRYRVYGIPTTHDKGCYYMQQWNATAVSGVVAGVAMCNFLRTCEITFLYLKLASCENKLLILTSGNSKYFELKRKIKVAGQTWDRKILQLWQALHI